MCGRFTLTTTPEELARHFGLDETPVLAPRFNVAPSQAIATVSCPPASARRTLVLRRWGLLPSWAKDPKIAQRMINARAETLAGKPAFRAAFRKRRCLVPADGYYEWAVRAGARKQPYHITLSGRHCFGIAGLWESWRDPDGGTLESCTLLTTQSHATLRAVHDRMPVIVDPGDYADWLDPAADADAVLQRLLASAASRPLELHPVGRRVNDPRFDDPACLEPAAAGSTD